MSGEIMLDISTHFKDVLQIIEEMKGDKNFITLIDLIMWARYKDSTYLLHKADLRTINGISILVLMF